MLRGVPCASSNFCHKMPQVPKEFGGFMRQSLRLLSLTIGVVLVFAATGFSQGLSTSITAPYRIVPNITYVTANNFEAKLDVYSRSDTQTPQPTIIYIHG